MACFDYYALDFQLTVIFLCRMCRALMPGDDESMNDEAVWETLPVSNSNIRILLKLVLTVILNFFYVPIIECSDSLACSVLASMPSFRTQ